MENMNTPMAPAQRAKSGIIATSVVLLVIGLVAGYLIGRGGSGPVVSEPIFKDGNECGPDNNYCGLGSRPSGPIITTSVAPSVF